MPKILSPPQILSAGLRIDFVIFMKTPLEENILLKRSVFRSSAKTSPKDLIR